MTTAWQARICRATSSWGTGPARTRADRKSTRLNSSHGYISYAVFCLKKKNKHREQYPNKNAYRSVLVTHSHQQHTASSHPTALHRYDRTAHSCHYTNLITEPLSQFPL